MLVLDHVAVLAETLEAGVHHVEAALGVEMGPGGRHAHFGTHNRLIGLDPDLYLEAIAVDPAAPPPGHPRWFGLDTFAGPPRLDKWILRCDDMDAVLAQLPMAGVPVRLERGALSWTMAVPEDGQLPFDGLFPAIIEWHVDTPPGLSLPRCGLRLEALRIAHPAARALQALLEPLMDAPLVSFEQADEPALSAGFAGPDGVRWLS